MLVNEVVLLGVNVFLGAVYAQSIVGLVTLLVVDFPIETLGK